MKKVDRSEKVGEKRNKYAENQLSYNIYQWVLYGLYHDTIAKVKLNKLLLSRA